MRSSLIACLTLLCGLLAVCPIPQCVQAMGPDTSVDPASPGPCATSTSAIQVGGALEVVLYYPDADADHARLYPMLRVRPRASVLVTGASHCVFAVPGSSHCGLFCGGNTDTGKSALSQRYMTAWLNEMLHQSPDLHHFLLGDQANLDASQGLIVRQLDLVLELPLRTWLPISRAK